MGLPCPKCGGRVSGAGHSCTGGPPSTSEILLTQMAEIEQLKASLEKHQKYDRCLEDYGMGCERVASLKARIAELEAGTEISGKPADYRGRKVIRQLPADSPYPPEDGYEEGS